MQAMPISFIHCFCCRYVLNEWWIENKITGVPRLLVGKRNTDEVVHTLQMLQTDDMPHLAQVSLHFSELFCMEKSD